MKLKMKNNGRIISNVATQKEIAAFLKKNFNISKKDFTAFVRNARNNNYIWDCIDIDDARRYFGKYKISHAEMRENDVIIDFE